MKILLTIIFTILGLIIIALIYIYSGSYNISAIEPDTGLFRWILHTTMENSVEKYSENIKVPNLNDSLMIREGFVHYKAMCEVCHTAPGKEETEFAKGLNPSAPDLVKIGKNLNPAEVFWITKNGIKMTGMPAWGLTHSDDEIWGIVAAIKKISDISPEEYSSFTLGNNSGEEKMQSDGHSDHHH